MAKAIIKVSGRRIPNLSAIMPEHGATSISLRRRAARILPPNKIAISVETYCAHISDIETVKTPSIPAPIQKISISRLSGRGKIRSRATGFFILAGCADSSRPKASMTDTAVASERYRNTSLGPTMVASHAPTVIAKSGPTCSTDRLSPMRVPVLAGLTAA